MTLSILHLASKHNNKHPPSLADEDDESEAGEWDASPTHQDDADDESRNPAPTKHPRRSAMASSLSSSASSSSSTKSVRFDEYTRMDLYYPEDPSVDDDSEEEDSAISTWYNRKELRKFRRDCFVTVDMILSGFHNDNDNNDEDFPNFCPRGCEDKTPMGEAVRQRHWKTSVSAVLMFQKECQRKQKRQHRKVTRRNALRRPGKAPKALPALTEFMDPAIVSQIYTRYTEQAVRTACLMGQMDQRHSAVSELGGAQ